MARSFTSVVLTANDLVDGDVVWWTGSGWTRALAEASVIRTAEEADASEASLATSIEAARTVGIYRVDVFEKAGAPVPALRREEIRADRRPTFDYLAPPAVQKAA